MNKFLITGGLALVAAALYSCGGGKGEDPGRTYMPDMAYSRAYEAYGYNNVGDYERLKEKGVHYNGLPVPGTMARGDVSAYTLPGNDSGYAMAAGYRNPMDTITLNAGMRKEAERLYLIHCAICHGTKLDGNGPLWKDGEGPYPAAPRNLTDAYSKALSDGQMYHVIMYGKGQMGSYASQVQPEERWWIIKYIREKQGGTKTATDSTAAAGAGAAAATTGGTNAAATGTTTTTDTTNRR